MNLLRNIRYISIWKLLSLVVMLLILPVSVYFLKQATSYFLTAKGEPANLVIDMGNTRAIAPGLWKNLAQGGEAENATLADVNKQVSVLNPEYIRIDHIYDYYGVVSEGQRGKLVFDWSRLDAAVDSIVKTGARPFLSLSYMPLAVSSTGDDLGYPRNWSDWSQIVRSTVEHFSGKNNKNIVGVYYEVWNEPDLFGGYKTYGDKNYLDLYRYSVDGVLAANDVNDFKIGGPATTQFYPAWVDDLLSFCNDNNVRIDFLSWHRYSSDISEYANDVESLNSTLSKHPRYQGIEKIITEMGYSSDNDPAYDSLVGAAQTMASVVELDQKVDKAFSFEIVDGKGPQKYWGRWGILTNPSYGSVEKKPRYHAFEFMNKLLGRYVTVTGNGSWVKAMGRVDRNTLMLFVVNYDSDGKHYETVPINIVNATDGDYTLTREDFSGAKTNGKVTISGGTLELTELFSPNSAAIFTLEPVQ